MLQVCRSGPASARVEGIDTSDADERALMHPGSGRFEVLPTA
jgi:hypothetical protein